MIKKVICMLLVALLLFTTACSNSKTQQVQGNNSKKALTLVSEGKSDYKIVISEKATEAEKYAASELQLFFQKSTSVKLPIINDNDESISKSDLLISVGKTQLFNKSNIALDAEKLKTDGFIIQSVNNTIYITGNEDRGTLYGCYDFLEKFLGIKFYAADEIKIPSYESLGIDAVKIEEVPDFWGRDSHFYNTIFNPQFAAKMRQNGVRVPLDEKYGYGSMTEWSKEWAHTFLQLLPPKKYYDEHPNWYANPNAKTGAISQICLTDEQLQKEVVANLKQWIIDQPKAKYFSVSQEDVAQPCKCEKCKNSDIKYNTSGTLMRFVNQIARDIKEWADVELPDREIYIVTFAYQHTTAAPVKKTESGEFEPIDSSVVPEKNVYVRLTSIWNCFYHDLMDTDCSINVAFHDSMVGWSSITDRLMMWTYSTNFFNYLLPFDNFQTIQNNYKMFKERNIKEILDNGAYDTSRTEMQELRVFLESKLQWNCNLDTNQLIDEFVTEYYKQAAPFVKEYLKMQRMHFATLDAENKFHMRLYDETPNITDPQNYPKRYLQQQIKLFEDALIEVQKIEDPKEKNKLEDRVIAASLAPRYMVLINYMAYYDQSTLEAFATKFFEDCDRVGLIKYREGTPVSSLREQFLKQ